VEEPGQPSEQGHYAADARKRAKSAGD